jgi:phosphoserine phosphatase RsbU/P
VVIEPALEQLTTLLDGAHLATPDELPSVVSVAGSVLGWETQIYLIDYAQRELVPLRVAGRSLPANEDVKGSAAGRAFRSVDVIVVGDDQSARMWVPLLDGVERLGVLELRFPPTTDLDETWLRNQIRWFAHLTGHLVASKSPYGDTYHRARAADHRSVASELIWSLLPPLTMACGTAVISGLLEPAEEVAGDVFDYAVEDGVAHVAIFDATGHDLHSSVIGALTLAAYRNGRRRREDMIAIAARVDDTLLAYADNTYATGIIGELELATGVFRYISAGHPAPLLLRSGRVVRSLDGGRRILLGFPNRTAVVAEEHLEPGDVVVLYTDGVIEARDESRQFFGLDRFVEILERSAADRQKAPETLRGVVHRVLEHQHGVLQDDASILIIDVNPSCQLGTLPSSPSRRHLPRGLRPRTRSARRATSALQRHAKRRLTRLDCADDRTRCFPQRRVGPSGQDHRGRGGDQ